MSIISGPAVKDFYTVDQASGWYSVNLKSIRNAEQAQVIETQVVSDARMERLKAVGIFLIAVGAGTLLAGAAYLAFKVASFFIGIFFFLMIEPFYSLITTLGGLAVGGTVGYVALKKYAEGFFNDAKKHWEYGDHLYQQAHAVRLKKAEL